MFHAQGMLIRALDGIFRRREIMRVAFKPARVALALMLLLVLAAPILSQAASSSQAPVLLEAVFHYVYPGDVASETTRVYVDGRNAREGVFIEQAKSGRRIRNLRRWRNR
ncbi:MAG TPA: hypothetical protein VGC89_03405 [Pyrinomonadaceae bacterium]|jgi:hypothetical protein